MPRSYTLSLIFTLAAVMAIMLFWLGGDPDGMMLNCIFMVGATMFIIQSIKRPARKRTIHIAAWALGGTVILIALDNLVHARSSYSLLAIASIGMYLMQTQLRNPKKSA